MRCSFNEYPLYANYCARLRVYPQRNVRRHKHTFDNHQLPPWFVNAWSSFEPCEVLMTSTQYPKRPVEMRCRCSGLELGRRRGWKAQGFNFLIHTILISSPLFFYLWGHGSLVRSKSVGHACHGCHGCPSRSSVELKKIWIPHPLPRFQNQNYQSGARDSIFCNIPLAVLTHIQC